VWLRVPTQGVMTACAGFKNLQVKCPGRWKSIQTTLWLYSSGTVKIVGVKSKVEAVRVARSFTNIVRSVRGFDDVVMKPGYKLSECRVYLCATV